MCVLKMEALDAIVKKSSKEKLLLEQHFRLTWLAKWEFRKCWPSWHIYDEDFKVKTKAYLEMIHSTTYLKIKH